MSAPGAEPERLTDFEAWLVAELEAAAVREQQLRDAHWEIVGSQKAGPVARRISGRVLGLGNPGAIHQPVAQDEGKP